MHYSDEELAKGYIDNVLDHNFHPDDVDSFRTSLISWYSRIKRPLPWRTDEPDAYSIWISEIMCQQTRVETVSQYWKDWMKRFPNVLFCPF